MTENEIVLMILSHTSVPLKSRSFFSSSSFLSPPPSNMFPTHSQSVVSWSNFYGSAPYKSPRLFYDLCEPGQVFHERDNERSFLSLFFFVSSHSRIPLTFSHWNSFAPCSRMATDASTDLQCSETIVNRMLFRVIPIRVSSYYYFIIFGISSVVIRPTGNTEYAIK